MKESSSDSGSDYEVVDEDELTITESLTDVTEVAGLLYPGEDAEEKFVWDCLANLHQKAKQSPNSQKVFANL